MRIHKQLILALLLMPHLLAVDGATPQKQAAAVISLVSPAPGTSYDIGACIPLRVDLKPSPAAPVTSVRYYDGPSLIADVGAPYRFAWTTAGRGQHTLRAVAIDDHGTTSSSKITITLKDPTTPVDLANDVDRYNVTFTTLGKNARDSMPLGNGDISVNAWTYDNGDIGLLIGKLDAFSGEAGAQGFFSLRKIGRVRIAVDPPVFRQAADKGTFKQTLVLSGAAIKFAGEGSELTLWVDKNYPVVRAQLSGKTKVTLTVSDDPWRTKDVAGTHAADTVFTGLPNQVAWCYHDPRTTTDYRNAHEKGTIQMSAPGADMLPQLTTVSFGALIEGEGLTSVDARTLRSGSVTHCRADINVLRYSKLNEATPAKWLTLMQEQAAENRSLPVATAWKDHLLWWNAYWNRNYLVVSEGPQHEDVTSHYLHLRFMNACQTGPMKELWRIPFNGGTFNVDFLDVDIGKGMGVNPQKPETMMTPDFRLWGASDRPQNARHIYWPMLQTGDHDQARAWFLWPAIVAKHWQKTVEEKTDLRGAFMSVGCSGWESLQPSLFIKRDAQAASRILPEGIGKETGGRNFCFDVADEYLPYMIDYYELTRDEDFLANQLVPYTQGLFKFFDSYFTRDTRGKLVLWPCMTSEAYVRFPENGFVPANPMGGVALIHSQLPRLIALKGKPGITADALALWQRVYDARPDMPVAVRRNGKPGLAPHEPDWDMEQKKSQGNDRSSLYAIWPYRAFMFPASGTSPEDYELAKNALTLDDNGSQSWAYGDYCAAILGDSARARKGVLHRINGTTDNPSDKPDGYFRFPAFSYKQMPDWTPNVEGGNVILSTLNYMLWNWKGDQIYLCPAWPKDWDCKFKFHAPHNTVVQGHVSHGEVTLDHVVPESRRRDIVICKPQ